MKNVLSYNNEGLLIQLWSFEFQQNFNKKITLKIINKKEINYKKKKYTYGETCDLAE